MFRTTCAAFFTLLISTANVLANDNFNVLGVAPGQALTQEQLNAAIENIATKIKLVEDSEFPVIDESKTQPYEIWKYSLFGESEVVALSMLVVPQKKLYLISRVERTADYKKLREAPVLEDLKNSVAKKYGEISLISMDQIRSDGTSDYSDYRVLFKSGEIGRTEESLRQCEFNKKHGPTGYDEKCKTVMHFNAYAKPISLGGKQTLMVTTYTISISDVEVSRMLSAQRLKDKQNTESTPRRNEPEL